MSICNTNINEEESEIINISDHFCSWVSQVLVPIFDNDENLVRIPECVAYGNDVATISRIINVIKSL